MINVIGMGYIGLPTALMLAANGNVVVGTDVKEELVEGLKNGVLSFEEQGLNTCFKKAIENGIVFSTEYVKADYYIIAVPTPYDATSKKVDSEFVLCAISSVVQICPDSSTIIVESTIPPGTIDKYLRPIVREAEMFRNIRINLAHAPERIIPGKMIEELVNNDRTVGVDDFVVGESIKQIYSSFCKGEVSLTDIKTAEMSKVVENTYRDINIAFANELAMICQTAGVDVHKVIRIANKHPRVNILQPGPGVGGHCISVDPWFLVGDYPGLANIILAARKINDSMPERVLEKISMIMKENDIEDLSKVGIYGLSYKEDVNDFRNSPTLQMISCMDRHLARGVKVYDPMINDKIVENQMFDFFEFVEQVDLVVIMVNHSHLLENLNRLEGKVVFCTKEIPGYDSCYIL